MKFIFPGSFDPLTKGHLDIIERSAKLCDELVLGVLDNVAKKYYFSVEERMAMLADATAHIDNVEIIYFSGLLADCVKGTGADAVIRGTRNIIDYQYEQDLAICNSLYGDVETIFLITKPEYAAISSSVVRELLHFGGEISGFVPEAVEKFIKKNTK